MAEGKERMMMLKNKKAISVIAFQFNHVISLSCFLGNPVLKYLSRHEQVSNSPVVT